MNNLVLYYDYNWLYILYNHDLWRATIWACMGSVCHIWVEVQDTLCDAFLLFHYLEIENDRVDIIFQ